MARARNIKPGFFKNEILGEQDPAIRLLFIGLWTLADREGRLEDRPKRIKGELFPFDSFDIDPMLNQLQTDKFLVRYEVEGLRYLQIVNFVKHQDPHYKEKASEIPSPPGSDDLIKAVGITRGKRAEILERDDHKCKQCGATEHLCIDHVVPVSRGGDSSSGNLQVLCFSCNTKKGNKLDGEEKGFRRSKHNDTSLRTRPDVESNLNQRNDASPSDSLTPDFGFLTPEPIPQTPKGLDPFDEFWKAYPNKTGKDAARKAFDKRKPGKQLLADMLMAIESQKLSEQWRKQGGQFIPLPTTWLNQGRWQDGDQVESLQQETFV